jgi:hypothetical protein
VASNVAFISSTAAVMRWPIVLAFSGERRKTILPLRSYPHEEVWWTRLRLIWLVLGFLLGRLLGYRGGLCGQVRLLLSFFSFFYFFIFIFCFKFPLLVLFN